MRSLSSKKYIVSLVGVCLLLFFLVAACQTATHYSAKRFSYPSGEQNYHDAIAFVLVKFSHKNMIGLAQGTAFAVDKDYLFTAGHGCKGPKGYKLDGVELIKITGYGWWKKSSSKTAIIVGVHDEKDVCILYSEDHGFAVLPLLEDPSQIRSGDPVTAIGCPAGIPYVKEYGIISQYDKSKHIISSNLRVERGSSGSPLIWNGQVIGLVYSYLVKEEYRRISNSVSSDFLLEYYREISER